MFPHQIPINCCALLSPLNERLADLTSFQTPILVMMDKIRADTPGIRKYDDIPSRKLREKTFPSKITNPAIESSDETFHVAQEYSTI